MDKKIVALGGVCTALLAILGLVFLVIPNWKPQPDPSAYGATLKIVSVEPNVGFDKELATLEVARLGGSGEYRKKYSGSRGAVIRFECEVKGKNGTEYPLIWTMYDAATKTRADESELHHQSSWPTANVHQKGTHTQLAGDLWVPFPQRLRRFFIRLEVIDPDTRRPLAFADSSDVDPRE